MCLAVPGKIEEILDDGFALADMMGVRAKIACDLVADIQAGDYVIVHAGFALSKLNREEALENLRCLEQLREPGGAGESDIV